MILCPCQIVLTAIQHIPKGHNCSYALLVVILKYQFAHAFIKLDTFTFIRISCIVYILLLKSFLYWIPLTLFLYCIPLKSFQHVKKRRGI